MRILSGKLLALYLLLATGCSLHSPLTSKSSGRILSHFDIQAGQGKKLLLHFWAPHCFICMPELELLRHLYPRLAQHNLELVAVGTFATADAIRESALKNMYPFDVVIDDNSKIAEQFGVIVLPQTLIIDEQRNIENIKRLEGVQHWNSAEVQREILGE